VTADLEYLVGDASSRGSVQHRESWFGPSSGNQRDRGGTNLIRHAMWTPSRWSCYSRREICRREYQLDRYPAWSINWETAMFVYSRHDRIAFVSIRMIVFDLRELIEGKVFRTLTWTVLDLGAW